MQNCLGELNLTYPLIYLDDAIMYSKTEEEHLTYLRAILERFMEHSLKLKLSALRSVTWDTRCPLQVWNWVWKGSRELLRLRFHKCTPRSKSFWAQQGTSEAIPVRDRCFNQRIRHHPLPETGQWALSPSFLCQ